MTTADDRHDEDVWAEAVAEQHLPGPQQAARDEVVKPAGADVKATGSAPPARPASPGELFGPELSPLVDEVRKFVTTVGEKVSSASESISKGDSLGAMQDLAAPLRVKHPEVYGHLIAAGGELLAAYRSAVAASEKRWTAQKPTSSEQIDLD